MQQAELSMEQSTVLVSQGSGGIQGMAFSWHVGGEVQVTTHSLMAGFC